MSTGTPETTLADKFAGLALVAAVCAGFVQPVVADVIREVANNTLHSTAAQAAGSNFRFSPDRQRLGEFEFVHNTWAYDNGKNIEKNPAADAARTAELLARHGYVMDDELIMSRFVTEVGDARRNELIIFYIETLAKNKASLEDFPDGGPASEKFDRLSNSMTRRSLKAMRFLELPQ